MPALAARSSHGGAYRPHAGNHGGKAAFDLAQLSVADTRQMMLMDGQTTFFIYTLSLFLYTVSRLYGATNCAISVDDISRGFHIQPMLCPGFDRPTLTTLLQTVTALYILILPHPLPSLCRPRRKATLLR